MAAKTLNNVKLNVTAKTYNDLVSIETSENIAHSIGKIKYFMDMIINNGKQIPSDLLPSYVDDVLDAYYYDGKMYKEETHVHEYEAETGKIYLDISVTPAKAYRFSGTTYVEISSGGGVNPVVMTGATESADGAAGYAPQPLIADRLSYLRGDGTWSADPVVPSDTLTLNCIADT